MLKALTNVRGLLHWKVDAPNTGAWGVRRPRRRRPGDPPGGIDKTSRVAVRPWSHERTARHTLRNWRQYMSKVFFVTGARRGMGTDIARAVLAAGNRR